MTASLPILDLARLDAGETERKTFLEDLRRAAREVGFFYLVGHGIGLERQAQEEALDLVRAALHLEQHAAVVVQHPARELELLGEAKDVGPKADPLHRALDPGANAPGRACSA